MSKLKKLLHRNIYPILMYFLPIKNKKVIFSSYAGKQYSGNPRIISEKLHEMYPETDIVWLMNNFGKVINDIPSYVRVVENESFLAAYELYTAKIWVDNCRKPTFFKKRKKQTYIQTWHGTPFKLIEADAGKKLGKRYRKYAKRDSKNIDLLISGNKYSTKILKRAFEYDGTLFENGNPRNDMFFSDNKDVIKNIKEKYNLTNEKIILYAPTFRNDIIKNGLNQLEELDAKIILEKFEKKYSCDFVLLYRFHSNVSEIINEDEIKQKYGDKFINVSNYPDMQELLVSTDILITDYSSSFIDYSLLKRPIFLFMYDYKSYIDERGLYLNLDALPFYMSKDINELKKQINEMELEDAERKCEVFLEFIGNFDKGDATYNIVKYIIDRIKD